MCLRWVLKWWPTGHHLLCCQATISNHITLPIFCVRSYVHSTMGEMITTSDKRVVLPCQGCIFPYQLLFIIVIYIYIYNWFNDISIYTKWYGILLSFGWLILLIDKYLRLFFLSSQVAWWTALKVNFLSAHLSSLIRLVILIVHAWKSWA